MKYAFNIQVFNLGKKKKNKFYNIEKCYYPKR